MKKATKEEFIDLLNDFKSKNNIEDNRFDYYATFKFYKSTFLDNFYDMSLVKTDSDEHPIMISHSNRNLLVMDDESHKFMEFDSPNRPEFVPIIKDKNIEQIQELMNILDDSRSFKEFVEPAFKFLDKLNNFSKLAKGVSSIKIIELFDGLKEALSKEVVSETSLRHYLDGLIDQLATSLYIGNELTTYQLTHLFRIRTTEDPDTIMNTLYERFDKYFDLFKIQQSLIIGRLLNAETEAEVLNKPLLNQFIEEAKTTHPEWFKSFDESLTHCMTDDNAIRFSGVPLATATADFDLIEPKSFMATAYPSYTDGFSHLSNRFKSSESNDVHLYGDNVFFKAYYHNLHIEQDNGLTYCKSVDSDVAFCLKDSDKKDFITPVLDYLDKNEIVLNLSRDSTLYHHIKKDDLAVLVKSEYPNLVFINDELGYKKLGAIFDAKTYKEALSIYQGTDEQAVSKRIKNKAGILK